LYDKFGKYVGDDNATACVVIKVKQSMTRL